MGKNHQHQSYDIDPAVRLATFNTQNLALAGKAYYPHQSYTADEYHKKLEFVAGQLSRMDAHVVGFQEVFDSLALEEAIRRSGAYKGQRHLVMGTETGDLPRVALLSRFPVLSWEVVEDFPPEARVDWEASPLPFTRFHRPVIKARILFPGDVEVLVLVVHLKSKRPMTIPGEDRHDPWHEAKGQVRSLLLRACESAALRWIILREVQGSHRPLVVLGDFNDATHAVTSDILQGRQPQRNYPMDVKKKLWDVLLYSCADIQLRRSFKDVYYTHLHNSQYESLDHILVSQEFVNENKNHVATVEYMRLYNDHLLDPALMDGPPPLWQSDHGQVLVGIKMRGGSRD